MEPENQKQFDLKGEGKNTKLKHKKIKAKKTEVKNFRAIVVSQITDWLKLKHRPSRPRKKFYAEC